MWGTHDVYEVLIRPADDSFRIKEQMFAQIPHFPVEYSRDGTTDPASEIVTVADQLWWLP